MVRLPFDLIWIPYYPSSKAGNEKKEGLSLGKGLLGLIDRKV